MKVEIKFIDHADQRYDTAGDWFWNEQGTLLTLHISKTADPKTDFAVAVHELIEALACKLNGVLQSEVDHWDMVEAAEETDPGLNPGAPYHHEHMTADKCERIFVEAVDLDWDTHNATLDQLEFKANA